MMPDFGEPDADWTDHYAWTRYRGPEAYPCPGGWVLAGVDGDAIAWEHYGSLGEGLGHSDDVIDEYGIDEYNEKRSSRAFFIDELKEFNPRKEIEVHRYRFSIEGTEVFARVDPDRDEWFGAIAAALDKAETGEPIEEWAADVEPQTGSPPEEELSKRKIEQRKENNQSLGDFDA